MVNTTQKPDQENLDPAKDVGQDGFDEIIDKNFSPGDEAMMEERAAGGLADQEANAATGTDSADDLSQGGIEQREESGDSTWQNNTSTEAPPKKGSFLGVRRNRNIAIGVFGTIFVVMGLFFTLGPSTAIIHLKEVMFDKFDSRLSTLSEKRNIRIMSKKMSKEFTTGCTVKVKCRFKGMTSREISKFEKRNPGTKIVADGRTIAGKRKVSGIQFIDDDGKQRFVKANNLKSSLRSSASLRNNIRNYNKPTVAHWRDVAASKMFNKFKVFRGKTKVASDAENKGKTTNEKQKIRIREAIRKYTSGGVFSSSIGTFSAADSDPDATNKNALADSVEDIGGDIEGEIEKVNEAKADPTKAIEPVPKASTVAKQAVKGVVEGSFRGAFTGYAGAGFNYLTKACAAKRMIATVGYLSKFMASGNLIRYASLYMVTADMTKAGDADGDSAQAIGDLGSILTTPDPETNQTFSDSFGYQYAAYGTLKKDKDGNIDTAEYAPYKMGAGLTGSLLGIANSLNSIPGVKTGCKVLLKPLVQVAGIAVTVAINVGEKIAEGVTCIVGLGSGCAIAGGSIALNILAVMAFMYAQSVLVPLAARTIAGVNPSGDEAGQDAGNAIVGGSGALMSMNGRFHGLHPISKDKAIAYDQFSDTTKSKVAADQKMNDFFNASNPRSFSSKMASLFRPPSHQSAFASLPGRLGSLPAVAFNLTPEARAAKAGAEYEVCGDPDYEELNIAADPFCNVQYGLDPSKVDAEENETYDSEKVIEYMCGSSVNNETDCSEGAYIDNDGNPQGEYASWLEDCTFSDQPISVDGENETPKECLDPSATDDPVKYTMFRMYTFDTSLDDQYSDRNGVTSEPDEGTAGKGSEPFDGSAQEAAKEILNSGNVTISDDKDLIKKAAEGESTPLAGAILKVLAGLSRNHKFTISSLYRGPCSGSNHCEGKAADIGAVDGKSVSYKGHDQKVQKFIDDAANLLKTNCENGVPNQGYVDKTTSNGSKCEVFIDIGTGPHVHIAKE